MNTPRTDAVAFGMLEDRMEGRYRRIVVDVEFCEGLENEIEVLRSELAEPPRSLAAMPCSALDLAMRFHETYERLAPAFEYETRLDTRAFDPTSKNGKLMVAVCAEILEQNATDIRTEGNVGKLPVLLPAIDAYIQSMPPHRRDEETASLLREAKKEIVRLTKPKLITQ